MMILNELLEVLWLPDSLMGFSMFMHLLFIHTKMYIKCFLYARHCVSTGHTVDNKTVEVLHSWNSQNGRGETFSN